jgi:hypothetical protein
VNVFRQIGDRWLLAGRHFGARSAVSVDRTSPIKHNTSLMSVSVQKALRCKTYNILSKRRASLETIKDKGEAVMESQTVVDHTEVDSSEAI